MLLATRLQFFRVHGFSKIVSRRTKENRWFVQGDPWKYFYQPINELFSRLVNELEVDNQPGRGVQLLAEILSSWWQGR